MTPIGVANNLVEELNSRIVPDEETAAFYKLKYGHIPKLVNNLYLDQGPFDTSFPQHGYNAISFGSKTSCDIIPDLLAEAWYILTTAFPGFYHPRVYIQGLGRAVIFLHNDVVFFMYGMEIVYTSRDGITYTILDDKGPI